MGYGFRFEEPNELSEEDLNFFWFGRKRDGVRKNKENRRKMLKQYMSYLKKHNYSEEQMKKKLNFEDLENLFKDLQMKEAEEEKKRLEQRRIDELKRKASVLRKYGGKVGFLVEHGIKFEHAEIMPKKDVENMFRRISQKLKDEGKIAAEEMNQRRLNELK